MSFFLLPLVECLCMRMQIYVCDWAVLKQGPDVPTLTFFGDQFDRPELGTVWGWRWVAVLGLAILGFVHKLWYLLTLQK